MRLLVQKLHPEAKLPVCAHPHEDLGYDIHAIEDTVLLPFRQVIVRTGIAARFVADGYKLDCQESNHDLPRYGLEVGDRSGIAAKNGIHTLAGKIDYGWTGEVGVVMILLGLPQATMDALRQEFPTPPNLDALDGNTLRQLFPPRPNLDAMDGITLLHLALSVGIPVSYEIKAGDRIAQIIPKRIVTEAPVEEVAKIPEDGVRGVNGYGSTGK